MTDETFDLPRLLSAVSVLDTDARVLQLEGSWYTWGALVGGARALEAALAAEGLGGEALPVGLVMHTTTATVATVFSLLTHRQTLMTLNHMQSPQRLAASISELDAVAVVAVPDAWTEETREAVADAGMWGVAMSPEFPADVQVVVAGRLTPSQIDERRRPGIALSMLTSGTTGPPKRIPLTYEKWARGIAGGLHFTSARGAEPKLRTGVVLLTTPLTHLGGVWRIVFSFVSGRAISLLPRFDVDSWVALIEEHRPPIATVPPPVLQMVLDHQVPPAALSALKALMVGTAPIDPALAEHFEDTYGIAVLANYGATEFAGAVSSWTLEDRRHYRTQKRGSVGRAHPDVELRIIDPASGGTVASGETGVLEIRAPQLATAGPDGWLRTNDLAALDEDGFLFIRGRADDAIIRGGFKLSAGEVASALREHPAVADAAVIGWPDERLGQVPIAAVELREGADADGASIRDWARGRLLYYQVPTEVLVLDTLPRGAMMKVDAGAVRELVAQHHVAAAD